MSLTTIVRFYYVVHEIEREMTEARCENEYRIGTRKYSVVYTTTTCLRADIP